MAEDDKEQLFIILRSINFTKFLNHTIIFQPEPPPPHLELIEIRNIIFSQVHELFVDKMRCSEGDEQNRKCTVLPK